MSDNLDCMSQSDTGAVHPSAPAGVRFFYWNRSFEIGIPEIDRQHQRLVDLINELAAAVLDGQTLPELREIFAHLTAYAAEHFRDEERLLGEAHLDEADKKRHRAAHASFVQRVSELMGQADLTETDTAEQVLDFLTTWLVSHILGSDKKAFSPNRNTAKEVSGLLDISPVERMLVSALSETERRFRLITDHTPALIWVSDGRGQRGFSNRSWLQFVGRSDASGVVDDWLGFVHPEDQERYSAVLAQATRDAQPVEVEYRLRSAAGPYHWFLERVLPRLDPQGLPLGMIGSATDISALKDAETLMAQANQELEQEVARRTAQLEQLMLTDPLTGVGNRRFLQNRLAEEIGRARRYDRPLTVGFFDIDHFKRINDDYGHVVGDEVLVRVARSLQAGLRTTDGLARFGGEEFVVLLPETLVADAEGLAERMRVGLGGLRLPDVADLRLTASVGLAQWMPNELRDEVLRRADNALYAAKHAGRNCLRVAPAP